MQIGIIGATGKAGSLIRNEAQARGHEVTAIVRNASKISDSSINILEKNVLDLTNADLQGFDVVVNAFAAAPGQEAQYVEVGRVLIEALKGTNTRLFVIGGAGSLFVDEAKTLRLMETPDFPKEYYPTAFHAGENLKDLEQSSNVKWTYLSPAAFFNPHGQRTGSYREGKDHVIVNSNGQSYVSYADYAIAVLDELEQPKHIYERYTVVSEAE
ncbi:NAD(P)-dependent oxidoreductase [Paenibacillus sp. MDMC362]|uniref:NAD(P)-dependent oxidoreductase n=1 Tax=Paenibacillus sp. MDMC362 TaxID=2977365 RepID=UPI000DC4E59A|nr:NAD(P)-dependent oxidoreductase [Paenibacillus sp. MDMC362]RAR45642.1 NAD(P)-dependent oxidoreductase [Paenibacillus sp. MDMC362]